MGTSEPATILVPQVAVIMCLRRMPKVGRLLEEFENGGNRATLIFMFATVLEGGKGRLQFTVYWAARIIGLLQYS